jgi:hypothetical protein
MPTYKTERSLADKLDNIIQSLETLVTRAESNSKGREPELERLRRLH